MSKKVFLVKLSVVEGDVDNVLSIVERYGFCDFGLKNRGFRDFDLKNRLLVFKIFVEQEDKEKGVWSIWSEKM